jgi:prevent-host-death family protein
MTHRSPRGTIVVIMIVEPLRTVKSRFSEFIDVVEREHERVLVTRNGRAAAVLISADELESLELTIEVLSEPGALQDLTEARQAIAGGEAGTPLEDVIDEIRARAKD